METEKEYSNVFAIPANYTDSGRIMGGMLETRNAIEAVIIVGLIGYPEIAWLPLDTTIKIVVVVVTIIPVGVVALMGIGGDSLMQYMSHIVEYWFSRRKLHYRRIGHKYGENSKDRKKKKKKQAKKNK